MQILEVTHLRKQYRRTVAVADVSFSVSEGCCFGLLGPNGAGKTTAMEVIEDIIQPTSGTILYKGERRGDTFRQEVGIQFQHTSLLNFLSVHETLRVYSKLFEAPEDIDRLIECCDLSSLLQRRNNQLSGGQQQRLMLALALINRPRLVFLDEPSTGLDPQSRRYLWEIIEEIKQEGKTIIMTTHSMEEAETLCDTIAIMDQGKTIAEGTPAQLISTHCKSNTITLPRQAAAPHLDCLAIPYDLSSTMLSIRTKDVDKTLGLLISCGVDLTDMTVRSADLEDVFLHLTGKNLRE